MNEPDPVPTHYSVLGLDPRASPEQVESAYRFSMDMYREGSEEKEAVLARIAAAFAVLGDAGSRRVYDESIGLARATTAVSASGPSVTPTAPSPDSPAPPAAPPRLPDIATGGDLKRIRSARGLSLREISVVTKIGVRFLEYIEEDRLAMLPPPVYLRGFLMEYGRMLGLDPRRTAEAYMARLPRRP